MANLPPVPAMLPMTSGPAMTPGYLCQIRSTRDAMSPALSVLRHACTCQHCVFCEARLSGSCNSFMSCLRHLPSRRVSVSAGVHSTVPHCHQGASIRRLHGRA